LKSSSSDDIETKYIGLSGTPLHSLTSRIAKYLNITPTLFMQTFAILIGARADWEGWWIGWISREIVELANLRMLGLMAGPQFNPFEVP
jgi:hypothetical protein